MKLQLGQCRCLLLGPRVKLLVLSLIEHLLAGQLFLFYLLGQLGVSVTLRVSLPAHRDAFLDSGYLLWCGRDRARRCKIADLLLVSHFSRRRERLPSLTRLLLMPLDIVASICVFHR